MLECWKAVYRAARVGRGDRIFFAFSFGPFLGFWTAFDAAWQIGAHAIPAGGMSSQQRLAMIGAVAPTVVCCTPTYALRLAEVDAEQTADRRPLSDSTVRAVIVAGEPGGSIPATRERIERAWGARVIDQHGLTEVGPVSFECWESPGALHVNESEFICEVVDPVDARSRRRRTAGRAAVDQPRPHRQPGDPLPHRRRRRPPIGAVRVRPDVRQARGRHHRAHRRHGQHPRRERVPRRHRVGPAPLRGGRRVPVDGVAIGGPAIAGRGGGADRRRPIRGRSPRGSRSGFATRWA